MSLNDKKRFFVIMKIKTWHKSRSIFDNLLIGNAGIGRRLMVDSGEGSFEMDVMRKCVLG